MQSNFSNTLTGEGRQNEKSKIKKRVTLKGKWNILLYVKYFLLDAVKRVLKHLKFMTNPPIKDPITFLPVPSV